MKVVYIRRLNEQNEPELVARVMLKPDATQVEIDGDPSIVQELKAGVNTLSGFISPGDGDAFLDALPSKLNNPKMALAEPAVETEAPEALAA